MRPRVSRSPSEAGNAVLEFVLFFTVGLVLIVSLTSNFEANLRGRTAALNIANQSLRAWQITSDRSLAQQAAADAAAVFLLKASNWSAVYDFGCSAQSRIAEVTVKIGQVSERAQGAC